MPRHTSRDASRAAMTMADWHSAIAAEGGAAAEAQNRPIAGGRYSPGYDVGTQTTERDWSWHVATDDSGQVATTTKDNMPTAILRPPGAGPYSMGPYNLPHRANEPAAHAGLPLLDPEAHIDITSTAPGSSGLHGPGERVGTRMPFGGSTDARPEFTDVHKPTRQVWEEKGFDVMRDASEADPKYHPMTGKFMGMKPVHGGGLFDDLVSGGHVRKPVHMIIDPGDPQYGHPGLLGTTGGQNFKRTTGGSYVPGDMPDQGGFGHMEAVQWQGHHRVKAAAMKQELLRESGQSNWQEPVPYEHHAGAFAAVQANPRIEQAEFSDMMKAHAIKQRKAQLARMLGGLGTT